MLVALDEHDVVQVELVDEAHQKVGLDPENFLLGHDEPGQE